MYRVAGISYMYVTPIDTSDQGGDAMSTVRGVLIFKATPEQND